MLVVTHSMFVDFVLVLYLCCLRLLFLVLTCLSCLMFYLVGWFGGCCLCLLWNVGLLLFDFWFIVDF